MTAWCAFFVRFLATLTAAASPTTDGATLLPTPLKADPVRAFRHNAVGPVLAIREAAKRAQMDAKTRGEFDQLIDSYIQEIDTAFDDARTQKGSAKAFLELGSTLLNTFQERSLVPWLKARPDVRAEINRKGLDGADRLMFVLAMPAGPNSVIDAVRRAGLPEDRINEAKQIVSDARQRLAAREDLARQWGQQINAIDDPDERQIAEATARADLDSRLSHVEWSVFDNLRGLFPPNQRAAFDDELPRLSVQPDAR